MFKQLLFGILIVSMLAYADQRIVKTIEYPIGFVASANANTDYIGTISVTPPDGISKINSLEIMITGDYQATTTVYAKVRETGKTKIYNCTPISVVTANAVLRNYNTVFDCSNLVKTFKWKGGSIDIGFRADKTSTNINARAVMTYYNNPKAEIKQFGTEYNNDQAVKIWLQVSNNTGGYVTNASCFANVYTPDNLQEVTNAEMSYIGHDGMYYYDMQSPLREGVYPAISTCYYDTSKYQLWANDFNLTAGFDGGIDPVDLYDIDGIVNVIEETHERWRPPYSWPKDHFSIEYYFFGDSTCAHTPESQLIGLNVFAYGMFDSAEDDVITMSIYNYTSASWITLPNQMNAGTSYVSMANILMVKNVTRAGLWSNTYGFKIRFADNSGMIDFGPSQFLLDQLYISCDRSTSNPPNIISSSSEIHVTSSGDSKISVATFCGEPGDSSCGVFSYDQNFWNYSWGFIVDNVVVKNKYQTRVNQKYDYETPSGVDCTGYMDIWVSEENGTMYHIDNGSLIFKTGTKDNCIIEIPIFLGPGTNYISYDVYFDNYMKWEADHDMNNVQYYKLILDKYCRQVETITGIPFEIPIQSQDLTIYNDNPVYLACYRAMDDLYQFEKYYNDSLAIYYTGQYESYLSELKYYYPEIEKSAGMIQQYGKDSTLFYESHTLCNDSSHEYTCAKLRGPDSRFDSQEGYIEENISIMNIFNTDFHSSYIYTAANGIDCSALMDIVVKKGIVETSIIDSVTTTLGMNDNCQMTIPIDMLSVEKNETITIYMQNYMSWDIMWAHDFVNSMNATIAPYCANVSLIAGVPYVLPVNRSLDAYKSNAELYYCYRAMDNLYWWYYYYDIFSNSNINTVSDIESLHFESQAFWPMIYDDYNVLSTYKRNANQVLTLSTVSKIYTDTARMVWNYTPRNLTYYPTSGGSNISYGNLATAVWQRAVRNLTYSNITAGRLAPGIWNNPTRTLTNASVIAKDIWVYNGVVNLNLIAKFTAQLWNYTGRYVQGIIN
jgi:hypothetical protein